MTDGSVQRSEDSISSSALIRAKSGDEQAFQRITQLYAGLVYHWCRTAGLSPEDAQDVSQQVFLTVHKSLNGFRREKPGDSFRGWLRVITRSRLTDFFRSKPIELAQGGEQNWTLNIQALESESDVGKPRTEAILIYERALKLIAGEFSDRDCQAFQMITIDGASPQDVALKLGMTTNAVYIAKSRILKRLRDEFMEVLDDQLAN